MEASALRAKTRELRRFILDLVYRAEAGHIGGDLSVIDMLAVLYCREMNITPETADHPDRDRLVLSKGHSVEALYAVLAHRGFLDREQLLQNYLACGSPYIGHPNNKLPGIEMNTGSLGHGLPVAVGMALAGKMDRKRYRVYAVLGDGELAEGSVMEAFAAGAHYRLDNLVALIDRNGLQISGGTEEVMALGDLAAKLGAYGWKVIQVADGNDVEQLGAALDRARDSKGAPSVLIAHTVKGKGVSFMENQAGWHHRVPTPEEYAAACEELRGEGAR